MHSIKQIPSRQTFEVRQPVLRPGKPVESCIFDGDDLSTTAHFGIYDNDTLVGVVSVFKSKSHLFDEENQFQLRGMAVLDSHQKQGIGEKLVHKAEEYISNNAGKLIWFNAREIAVGFYNRMGYNTTGDPFDIGDIGAHYVMFKNLS